jgi:hypothetical protein
MRQPLLLIAVLYLASPASAQHGAPAVEIELAEIASGRDLWPGFDVLEIPLAIFDGERTWLFRHPAPPEGFEAFPGAHVHDGRYPAVTANSSAEIGGVLTATVLLDKDAPVRRQAALAVHEAFHVFQRTHHPEWYRFQARSMYRRSFRLASTGQCS